MEPPTLPLAPSNQSARQLVLVLVPGAPPAPPNDATTTCTMHHGAPTVRALRTTNHGGWHPVGCMKALRRLDAPSTHPPCSALQSAVVQPRKVQNTAWQCSADQWGVRSGGPLLYSAVGGPPRSSFPTHTHHPTLSSTSLAWTRYVLQSSNNSHYIDQQ